MPVISRAAGGLLRAEPWQEGPAVEDRAGELRHGCRAGHGRHHGWCGASSGEAVVRRRNGAVFGRRNGAVFGRRNGPGGRDAAGPKEGGKGDAPLPETKPIVWAAGKTKVLIIGGGSSHNFAQFFGKTDSATFAARGLQRQLHRGSRSGRSGTREGRCRCHQRQPAVLRHASVPEGALRLRGRGQRPRHAPPGTWYRIPSVARAERDDRRRRRARPRSHREYSVNVVKPDHPVMKGVPASFDVEDELYYLNAEADKIPPGTAAIDVLAETSPSVRYAAASGRVDHTAPHCPHRRHHARPR